MNVGRKQTGLLSTLSSNQEQYNGIETRNAIAAVVVAGGASVGGSV